MACRLLPILLNQYRSSWTTTYSDANAFNIYMYLTNKFIDNIDQQLVGGDFAVYSWKILELYIDTAIDLSLFISTAFTVLRVICRNPREITIDRFLQQSKLFIVLSLLMSCT